MRFEPSGRVPFETVEDFLGGPRPHAVDGWEFDFGPHLTSSWGGTYGGALGAAVVRVARQLVPDRAPRSLHLQMVRQVGLGGAHVTATEVHRGRTNSTVEVRLFEQRGRLAVLGLVTLLDATSLNRDLSYAAAEALEFRRRPFEANAYGSTPVVATLQMPTANELWEVTNLPPGVSGRPVCGSPVVTPWRDQLVSTGPELTCVVGDLCNGAAIVAGLPEDAMVAFPNSDLSLRFSADAATETAVGVGTLLAVHDGTAVADIRVQGGERQLGRGLAGSVLIPLDPAGVPAPRGDTVDLAT